MLFCQWDSAEELILPKSSRQPKTDKHQGSITSGSLTSALGHSKVWALYLYGGILLQLPGVAAGLTVHTLLAVSLPSSLVGLSAAPK